MSKLYLRLIKSDCFVGGLKLECQYFSVLHRWFEHVAKVGTTGLEIDQQMSDLEQTTISVPCFILET
jgi:hypothetical protein